MSKPRSVVPGRCYMATRRCSERRFFLRPDDYVVQTFWYILGWAAQKYNVGIVAATVMSNHYHLVAIDNDGRYPDFLRDLNALLARCINARRGRWEAFWSGSQTSMVQLIDEDAQIGKVTYTLCNPVQADLVRYARNWPGASSLEATLNNKPIRTRRPKHFFRDSTDEGSMPEWVELRFVTPPEFDDRRNEYVDRLSNSVAAVESIAESARRNKNRRTLGKRAILAQHWNDSPDSYEPRRLVSPRVAGKDKWKRAEAVLTNKAFEVAHRAALLLYRAGKQAVFPAGTWLMVRQHSVAVESG